MKFKSGAIIWIYLGPSTFQLCHGDPYHQRTVQLEHLTATGTEDVDTGHVYMKLFVVLDMIEIIIDIVDSSLPGN